MSFKRERDWRERKRKRENHREGEGYKKWDRSLETKKDRKRGMVRERKIGRETGWNRESERERDNHREGERETGVKQR